MNKQQLASKIWALANNLRGSVSAATYKDYILGFLFYKYLSAKEENYLKDKLKLSDTEIKELTEEDDLIKTDCMKNLGYFITYKNLFSTWFDDVNSDYSIGLVSEALSAFDRLIGINYKKVYEGIFTTLQKGLTNLGDGDASRTTNSKKIIKLVNSIPTDNKEDYDVLGFIYEFLLKNFAANAGKAGEFYTPHEASLIMSEIIANHLKNKEEIKVYDPTSGSGSLLINIGQAISKYLGNKNKVKYYAQELIEETYNLTRMNLIMRDILPSNIVARRGDTLDKDWPFFETNDPENTYEYLSVDACCSNPPYSQAWTPREDPRFDDYGLAPKSKADYAFLLHNLYHLNKDGIMTIVLPHGVLFRGGTEAEIRKQLIKKHNIETIIGLPANLFYGTGIPTIIMVLKKNRNDDDVLFIDASKGFVKDGNKNRLRQRDIRKIVDTVISRKTIPHYSRLVSYKEIADEKGNNFNLNIPRYVDSSIKSVPHDIYALMFGGLPNDEINSDKFSKFWEKFPTLKEELFVEQDIPYSSLKKEEVLDIIRENEEVKEFVNEHINRFSFLKTFLEEELLREPENIHIDSKEIEIANVLKSKLEEDGLVDYYDCFEVLDSVWQNVVLDLEAIKADGIEATKQIEDIVVLKKNSKTKELDEKIVGNDGRIIPYELIQDVFFKVDADNVHRLENELSSYTNEKDELLSSIEPEDKENLLKNDESGDIDTKKLNAEISKIKKELKKGAEYEEDSYESIILKIDIVSSKIKTIKTDLKKNKEILDKKNREKIVSLSNNEIHDLLIKKWVDPICDGIDDLANKLIKSFSDEIKNLVKKYTYILTDVDKDIRKTENELSSMLNELTGSEFDMKGINEFKKLLSGGNGENGEK